MWAMLFVFYLYKLKKRKGTFCSYHWFTETGKAESEHKLRAQAAQRSFWLAGGAIYVTPSYVLIEPELLSSEYLINDLFKW